jgi:hypothetical protein
LESLIKNLETGLKSKYDRKSRAKHNPMGGGSH